MLLLSVPQTFSLKLCFSSLFLSLSFSLCPLSNQIFEETVRNLTPLPRAQRRKRAPIVQPDVRLHTLHTEKLKRVCVCERMHVCLNCVFVYVYAFLCKFVCVCVRERERSGGGGFFGKYQISCPPSVSSHSQIQPESCFADRSMRRRKRRQPLADPFTVYTSIEPESHSLSLTHTHSLLSQDPTQGRDT